jgi:hypothetical protein
MDAINSGSQDTDKDNDDHIVDTINASKLLGTNIGMLNEHGQAAALCASRMERIIAET